MAEAIPAAIIPEISGNFTNAVYCNKWLLSIRGEVDSGTFVLAKLYILQYYLYVLLHTFSILCTFKPSSFTRSRTTSMLFTLRFSLIFNLYVGLAKSFQSALRRKRWTCSRAFSLSERKWYRRDGWNGREMSNKFIASSWHKTLRHWLASTFFSLDIMRYIKNIRSISEYENQIRSWLMISNYLKNYEIIRDKP